MGGVDRNYLFSEFKADNILYCFCPPFVVFCVLYIVKILISIIGFAYLSKVLYRDNTQKQQDNARELYVCGGIIYGLAPTWIGLPISFATIPFFVAVLIGFYRRIVGENMTKIDIIRYEIFFLIYPFFSDFTRFGIFICGYIALFGLIEWVVTHKAKWKLVFPIVNLSVGYVLTEYRLFFIMFLSEEETIRSLYTNEGVSFAEAIILSIKGFVLGQYHSYGIHTYIILPCCAIYFVISTMKRLKVKDIKGVFSDKLNWLLFFIVINCLIYGMTQSNVVIKFLSNVMPMLAGFKFSRTLWFNAFIWDWAFIVILYRVYISNRVRALFLFGISLLPIFFVGANDRTSYNLISKNVKGCFERIAEGKSEQLSYSDFYSVSLFDKIKREIDYNGEYSVAYGMFPGILQYNDISTLDGYLSIYSADYKKQFRKLIEPELEIDEENQINYDNSGIRAYVFSKDVDYIETREINANKYDMLISSREFEKMGGRYVFSRVEIGNIDALNLELCGTYTDENSPYTIWVYKLRYTN